MNKFLLISGLIVAFVACHSGTEQTSSNSNEQVAVNAVAITDSIYAKDLKAISKFADTLFIESFIPEIKNFMRDDSLHPHRKIDVIFTGSSSIRKWITLANDMSGLNVLNRGFGGSTIPQAIYYSDVLIFRHKPSKIVFYSGENDIATTDTDTNKVFASFLYLQKLIKQNLPQAQLYFVSIKPSPSRRAWWPEMQSVNRKIKLFCDSTENCNYIDVSSAMLNNNGTVRKEIFVADKLHLNKKGYEIWTKIIRESLEGKIDKRL